MLDGVAVGLFRGLSDTKRYKTNFNSERNEENVTKTKGLHTLGDGILRVIPGFAKTLHFPRKWNLAGSKACVMKQGQNYLSFQFHTMCTALANCSCYNVEMNQCPLCVHHLAYSPRNIRSMHTHKGDCFRYTFPLHVPATGSRYRFPLHVPRNISPTVCRPYCRNAISEFSRTKTSAICNEKGIASWTSLVCYFCFIVFCLIYAAPQTSSC